MLSAVVLASFFLHGAAAPWRVRALLSPLVRAAGGVRVHFVVGRTSTGSDLRAVARAQQARQLQDHERALEKSRMSRPLYEYLEHYS